MKPGYKQTDIGVIPEEWEAKSLSEIGHFKTGPFGTMLKAEEYYASEGAPLVSVGDIGAGVLNFGEHTPLVPPDVVRRLPQYILNAGDIVFGRKGGVERSAIVQADQAGCFLGSDGIRLRPSNESYAPFITYQLQRHDVRTWLLQNATGTTMPSMNQGILQRVCLPHPSEVEQRVIAEVLSDVDGLLDGIDQLIAKKRNLKQAAMQQLLTGQTRLPGFHGHWEVKLLGEEAIFFKGKGLPKSALDSFGGDPCIHYGELFTRYTETIHEVISRTDNPGNYFRSIANDVLMPTSDVTPRGLAKASCVMVDGVILGGDILVIRTNPERICGSFLSHIIRREENQVLQLVNGTTVFHLYGTDMKKFTFAMPSVEEQKAIVGVLSNMDEELAALEQRRTKTRALKQGMMQELLTGRTRLV